MKRSRMMTMNIELEHAAEGLGGGLGPPRTASDRTARLPLAYAAAVATIKI